MFAYSCIQTQSMKVLYRNDTYKLDKYLKNVAPNFRITSENIIDIEKI